LPENRPACSPEGPPHGGDAMQRPMTSIAKVAPCRIAGGRIAPTRRKSTPLRDRAARDSNEGCVYVLAAQGQPGKSAKLAEKILYIFSKTESD